MKPFSFWRLGGTACVLSLLGAPAGAATETVLYSFCSQQGCADGENPTAGLIRVKDTLYGTTFGGGTYSWGTVFSITPRGKEKVVYSFGNTPDGDLPRARLINVNGKLYGTTYGGGTHLVDGTVFSVDPITGTEKVLHSFADGSDGAYPWAGLINVNGILYGTTVNGGGTGCGYGGGCGTVFSVNPTTDQEKVVHSFGDGTRGAYPYASLINVNGTLYGTAFLGGYHNDGAVFSIKTGGKETVLHSFGSIGFDGQNPSASLSNVKGTLYGTTQTGGTGGVGTMFSVTTRDDEKVVYSFCNRQSCADGNYPSTSLIDVKGTLYGTTGGGGAYGRGSVFSFDPTTGTEHVLYSFGNGTDGWEPSALINVKGTLYGTTVYGGANGDGTVFSITP